MIGDAGPLLWSVGPSRYTGKKDAQVLHERPATRHLRGLVKALAPVFAEARFLDQ